MKKWFFKEASWWQFWMPQSGAAGRFSHGRRPWYSAMASMVKITVTADGIVREFGDVRDASDFVAHRCLNCSKDLSKLAGLFCRPCYRELTPDEKRSLAEKHRGRVVGAKNEE